VRIGRHAIEVADTQCIVFSTSAGNSANEAMHLTVTILPRHDHGCST
jgi:hypothetical protein